MKKENVNSNEKSRGGEKKSCSESCFVTEIFVHTLVQIILILP